MRIEKTIAFIGNPNVGKSAWINALSKADFKVGNWPGVSVERKEATLVWHQVTYHLIDLPGIYSLNAYHSEEQITIKFLNETSIDCIVNVVDASNLQRHLYLTLLLRELQIPILLIFNFYDEVIKYRIDMERKKLEEQLQISILCCSALNLNDYEMVQMAIEKTCRQTSYYKPLFDSLHQQIFKELYYEIDLNYPAHLIKNKQIITKITLAYLKKDERVIHQLNKWHYNLNDLNHISVNFPIEEIKNQYIIAIKDLLKYVHQDTSIRLKATYKIDNIMLNKYFSIPILLVLFLTMLFLIFRLSAPFSDFMDYFIHDYIMKYATYYLTQLNVNMHLRSLFVNGILGGVGGVIVFMPLMFFLNFFLSLLEECGYMARVAFILDKSMRVFHLNGKSLLSFLIGFACNVPAIYSTRNLASENQRKMTALLIPFMSCGARLPVYVLFASAFFDQKAGFVVLLLYAMGIAIALSLGFVFQHVQTFHEDELFVIELPPYRKPSFRVVLHKVKSELKAFLSKAIGVVMLAMMILWGLTNFPSGQIEDSYLARGAKQVSFLYVPLGFGTRWECVAALPGSLVAKETIVGFMDQVLIEQKEEGLVYDLKKDTRLLARTFGIKISDSIKSVLSIKPYQKSKTSLVYAISHLWKDRYAKLKAFSFMVYVLLSIPCIMTLFAIKREYGSSFLLLVVFTMLLVPYFVCLFLYQFFSLF
ncbi:MAG: ferrous iron transport protein B [Erysipelotrichaceae bacterium]